ncbi:hypothetical protein K439DRAFT_1418539 [Ramaria rubella]|nr:hypothetical protein K439DRAFT_1418539 [Ramaria rubella]
MYLFSRYILRVGECSPRDRDKKESTAIQRARRELTWDAAFGCLAISTKFYHDFLQPLYPIYSKDFLVISPQNLSRDQFEDTQRDILDAFDYEVHGVTPHAYFEEFWAALPSLRDILDFPYAQKIVQKEMWETLQHASLQWDLMRFPVSLLTAVALIEGIVFALADEYQNNGNGSGISQSETGESRDEGNLKQAHEDIEPINNEIAMLLGVSTVSFFGFLRFPFVI